MIYEVGEVEFIDFMLVYICVCGVDFLFFFGDFIVLSCFVDLVTVKFIKFLVLDGLIVFGFEEGVLGLLGVKKQGCYVLFEVDLVYILFEEEFWEV